MKKWVVVAEDDDRKTKRVARSIKNVIFLLFDAHNKRDESAMLGSQSKDPSQLDLQLILIFLYIEYLLYKGD